MGIPVELLYLVLLLVIIVVFFMFLKRPIYEAMFIGFLVMVFVLKQQDNLLTYLIPPLS